MTDEGVDRINSAIKFRDEKKGELLSAKAEVGELRQEVLKGTILEMFAEVGKKNSESIKKVLNFKKSKDRDGTRFKNSEISLYKTKKKAELLEKSTPEIGKALILYLTSLKSWAEGAGINESEAWILQDESFGCQTVMVRGENGEVFLGHTEEWAMGRDEKENTKIVPEWTTFIDTANPAKLNKLEAFTGYPFALPGSSFGVHNGKLIAVDSLEVRRTEDSLPANVAAWVAWYLAGKSEPEEIFKQLGPFADGYAYNEIGYNHDIKTVVAKKVEFAGALISTEYLSESPMEYMIQTNMVETTPLKNGISATLDEEDTAYYEGIRGTHNKIRQAWLGRFKKLKSENKQTPNFTFNSFSKEFSLITKNPDLLTIPQEFTYAHVFAVVKTDGKIETNISSGPVIPS